MRFEDWATLIGMGVASVVAFNGGKKEGIKEVKTELRENEIQLLRKEIAELRRERLEVKPIKIGG